MTIFGKCYNLLNNKSHYKFKLKRQYGKRKLVATDQLIGTSLAKMDDINLAQKKVSEKNGCLSVSLSVSQSFNMIDS